MFGGFEGMSEVFHINRLLWRFRRSYCGSLRINQVLFCGMLIYGGGG
jgi:hypothetical protein